MSNKLENVFGRKLGLAWQVIDGSVLILEPKSKMAHEINAVGSVIWQNLDGAKTVAEISDIVADEFEVSTEIAKADVQTFLQDLTEKELVQCQ